ncbi:hypothetical protein [Dyadobacter frigoris]|uniref:Uncharacterized protein n=1 Tax=Dyadobacter frigoris TaxID=2576211 RepID=A0A4U6D1W9_9BACT|nr:hypothetical protein [Dyadobacter frigoris]TKT90626.1 hypothetical protein FDK13_20095 [Dyadobacter frigoris]GLU51224.1 hypothetical protein Dfri01_06850 [Dyadobacter frigoris]
MIRIFRKQHQPDGDFPADVSFEVRSLCDIPILIFKLSQPGQVLAVPVNFRKIGIWPDMEKLPIHLQLFDLDADQVCFEKEIILSRQDTEAVLENRFEQKKMKSKQIDAIVDFIYSDYIGFAQLAETF